MAPSRFYCSLPVVARLFTPKIVTVITAPIPTFLVVAIIVALKVAVVETSAIVSGVISSRRLLVLLGSFDIFSDELFYVVGIGIIFGRGKQLSNRARPLAQ